MKAGGGGICAKGLGIWFFTVAVEEHLYEMLKSNERLIVYRRNEEKRMKKIRTLVFVFVIAFISVNVTMADEQATPKELHNKIMDGVAILQNLGDGGLTAFNDPKGELVWKDAYLFVMDCEKGVILAHPNGRLIGMTTDKIKEPGTGRLIMKETCDGTTPEGFWMEYDWGKNGVDGVFRKVLLAVPVPQSSYQVVGAIYDKDTSIEDLKKISAN